MSKIRLNQVVISGYINNNARTNDARNWLAFTVGVDRSYFDQKTGKWVNGASWINTKLFSKDTQRINTLLGKIVKGAQVVVIGTLEQSSYKNKNGDTVYETYVRANSVQVYENTGENQGSSQQNYQANPYEQNSQANPYEQGYGGGENLDFLNSIPTDVAAY